MRTIKEALQISLPSYTRLLMRVSEKLDLDITSGVVLDNFIKTDNTGSELEYYRIMVVINNKYNLEISCGEYREYYFTDDFAFNVIEFFHDFSSLKDITTVVFSTDKLENALRFIAKNS